MQQTIDPAKVEGLGILIDSSDEVLKEHCADKNIGYCLNLSNLLKMTYNQVSNMKEDLVKMKQTEEVEANLKAIYIQLARIEHKAALVDYIAKGKCLRTFRNT